MDLNYEKAVNVGKRSLTVEPITWRGSWLPVTGGVQAEVKEFYRHLSVMLDFCSGQDVKFDGIIHLYNSIILKSCLCKLVITIDFI